MVNAFGINNRRELALLASIVALVAVAPLGHEGTHPLVFVTYRVLLVAITFGSIVLLRPDSEQKPSLLFIGLCALVLLVMQISIQLNPGSRFDGSYSWNQHLLFGAAFVAMAAFHRYRTASWKRTILWSVVGIDLIYTAVDLFIGRRPLIGPFVNPNYFASFLLVGFSAAIAVALFESERVQRIAAASCAVFLYYGMTQAWSRGATLAAAGVAVLGIVRFSRERGIGRKKIAVIIGLVLIAGAVASPVLIRKFLDRGQVDPYNYERPQIWLSDLRIIAAHPILGVGLGEFFHVSKQFSPPVEGTVARYLKRPAIAHSEYLQYAAESGIPAAILLFALAGYLVAQAFQRARTCDSTQRVFQEAAILTAVGLGLHALVDNNWTVPGMAAGLVVFSLADVLPMERWNFTIPRSPRIRVLFGAGLVLVLRNAIIVPGLALYFNESGHAAFDGGQIDKAESLERLAAAIAPDHDVFLDNAGSVYFEMYLRSRDKRWLNYGEVLFRKAMLANPNSEGPGRHLETLLIQRLTGYPERDHAIHLQIVAVDRAILKVDPFNPFVRKNLAEALYNSGSRDEAERELNYAIKLEPNYVPAYLRISDWYRDSGNLSASESYQQKAIAVVVRYQNLKTSEPYETLLLGRPQAPPTRP